MKIYLINDDDLFNYRIDASSFRQALTLFKDLYRVQGRLRLVARYSNVKEYKLDKSSYKFSIIEISK
jgi:hypothetical protein